jgi:hypothetical protein
MKRKSFILFLRSLLNKHSASGFVVAIRLNGNKVRNMKLPLYDVTVKGGAK